MEKNDIRYQQIDDGEIVIKTPPHKRPLEYIILSIRDFFFKSLEMLTDKKNPIPYIFSTEERKFHFSLFLIIIGTLLLLLSNLMINQN